jgi:hypothetical protein
MLQMDSQSSLFVAVLALAFVAVGKQFVPLLVEAIRAWRGREQPLNRERKRRKPRAKHPKRQKESNPAMGTKQRGKLKRKRRPSL